MPVSQSSCLVPRSSLNLQSLRWPLCEVQMKKITSSIMLILRSVKFMMSTCEKTVWQAWHQESNSWRQGMFDLAKYFCSDFTSLPLHQTVQKWPSSSKINDPRISGEGSLRFRLSFFKYCTATHVPNGDNLSSLLHCYVTDIFRLNVSWVLRTMKLSQD